MTSSSVKPSDSQMVGDLSLALQEKNEELIESRHIGLLAQPPLLLGAEHSRFDPLLDAVSAAASGKK